jgi:hypothetical protein
MALGMTRIAGTTSTRLGKPLLSSKQVAARVFRRMGKYDKLNFLETYAMFMGKAQLVELGLKNLMINKYGFDEERIKNWPLGKVITALKERGFPEGFVELLEELKDRRNHIAHELLANDAILRKMTGSGGTVASRSIIKGLYCVETVIVLHDFLISKGFL